MPFVEMDFKKLKKNLQPLEAADHTADRLSSFLSVLTPSNIEMIVYDTKSNLKIDSAESLKQCVDVLFETAMNIDSPAIVAILCTKLLFSSVPVCEGSQKMITFKEQIYEKARSELENFLERQALINAGQSDAESEQEEGDVESECDVDEITQQSCYRKLRRPIALLKFIGELYLVEFLPSTFIEHCITQLLDDGFCNESTLETLYALLKLVGKKLEISDENSILDLTGYFKILESRKSSTAISPHTRFMIEELIEIRNNHWCAVREIDWIMLYNLFLCDVEEKLYVLELWYGK